MSFGENSIKRKQRINNIVKFVRDHQLRYSTEKVENSYQLKDGHYWISLYNRKEELLKGSREHHDEITKIYQEEVKRIYDD